MAIWEILTAKAKYINSGDRKAKAKTNA